MATGFEALREKKEKIKAIRRKNATKFRNINVDQSNLPGIEALKQRKNNPERFRKAIPKFTLQPISNQFSSKLTPDVGLGQQSPTKFGGIGDGLDSGIYNAFNQKGDSTLQQSSQFESFNPFAENQQQVTNALNPDNASTGSPEAAQGQLQNETNPFLQAIQQQAQMANERAAGMDAAKMQAYNQQQSNNALDATERARLNAVVRAGAAGDSSLANDYTRFQANPISIPQFANQQNTSTIDFAGSGNKAPNQVGNISTFNNQNALNQDGSLITDPSRRGSAKGLRNQNLLFGRR